jgi:hypothetical protein
MNMNRFTTNELYIILQETRYNNRNIEFESKEKKYKAYQKEKEICIQIANFPGKIKRAWLYAGEQIQKSAEINTIYNCDII